MERQTSIRNSWTRRGILTRLLGLSCVWGLASSAAGCQILIGVLMMIKGRPLLDADFKTLTGRKMTEKGKKVIVLCSAPETAKGDFSALNLDLIAEVSQRMKNQGIETLDPDKITDWLDEHPEELDDIEIVSLGKKFDADYVVQIVVDEFDYREANSPSLLRGRSNGSVTVTALDRVKGSKKITPKKIYSKPFESTFPIHQPVSAEQVSPPIFRKQYVDRLSDELARLFYDHRPGEDF